MRLPDSLLVRLRGPALAALALGCTGGGDGPAVAVEASTPVLLSTNAPTVADPVPYDAATEATRLERLDARDASADEHRERRLASAARAAPRARRSLSLDDLVFVPLSTSAGVSGCGRG